MAALFLSDVDVKQAMGLRKMIWKTVPTILGQYRAKLPTTEVSLGVSCKM